MLARMPVADGEVPLEQSACSESEERRRPGLARTDVCLRAKLLREGLTDLDIRLRNLSAAGFMAECLEPVAPNSKVVLSLPGAGLIPADVRWNVDFRIGAIFHWELSARELGLARSDPGASNGRREDDQGLS